jgi:hypothetical protein
MNDAVKMGSGAMIYIPSFIKDWFRHTKVDRQEFTATQHGDLIGLLLFCQDKDSRLINRISQYVT